MFKGWVMRKLTTMALASGALILAYAATGLAAEIVGTIVDLAGAPISGVTVSAQNRAGITVGVSVSDATGKYAIQGIASGIYILMAKGQTAVAYVGDQGITVDWGIAANSQIIAAARKGTAPLLTSFSGRSSMRDLASKQVDATKGDRSANAVQRGDCADDEDDGEEGEDSEIAANVQPTAEAQGRRHCQQTESH
jgi:Carboxypeptidase regulatory-like domain